MFMWFVFLVVIYVNFDMLFVDEVLSVGDVLFCVKCV